MASFLYTVVSSKLEREKPKGLSLSEMVKIIPIRAVVSKAVTTI